MTYWAIEFKPRSGRPWINHHTLRELKREAWQAAIDLDSSAAWWDELHKKRDAGEAVAVKVRIVKEQP
jgi:hypothetical protein